MTSCSAVQSATSQVYAGGAEGRATSGSERSTNALSVLERRRVDASVRRERNPELSANHIVVAAADAAGRELFRRIILDPRLLRAEVLDASGQLRTDTLHYATVDFSVALPADPAIAGLVLYEPRWTGQAWRLDPIARIPLP